jgi:PhnB protein
MFGGRRDTMADSEQGVVPMIAYEDGPAALDWLSRAFGFREVTRMLDDTGRLSHGEMETDYGLIMLATPTPRYESPAHHRQTCDASREWQESVPYVIDGTLVYVRDAASHFERAQSSGATILSPLDTDEHGARYRAEDIEGHRWMFIQR